MNNLELATGKEKFLFLQSARLTLTRMSDKILLIFYFKTIWLQFPCEYIYLSKQDSVFITSPSQWENVRLFVCVVFVVFFLFMFSPCSSHKGSMCACQPFVIHVCGADWALPCFVWTTSFTSPCRSLCQIIFLLLATFHRVVVFPIILFDMFVRVFFVWLVIFLTA